MKAVASRLVLLIMLLRLCRTVDSPRPFFHVSLCALQLYNNAVDFAADMLSSNEASGGPLSLVKEATQPLTACKLATRSVLQQSWAREMVLVPYEPRAAACGMREVSDDSGWVENV